MKRVYVLLGLSGLYGLNRVLLLPWLNGAVQNLQGTGMSAEVLYRFLSGYGADVLAGAWILCFLNLLLVWSGRKKLKPVPGVLFGVGWGVW